MRIPLGTQLAPRQPVDLPPFVTIPELAMPFPAASGTTLQPVPQTYPGSSLTYESFLYSQLQNSVQPGTANTFTAPQSFEAPLTISGTDTATNTALRLQTFEHKTSGVVAAGFGVEHQWQSRDGSGNLAPTARMQVDVTNPTTGSVQSAWGFAVNQGGVLCEALRLRPGMAAVVDASSFTGFVGSQVWVRGSLLHSGDALGFFNVGPVAKPAVTGSRGSNAALASLLSALASLGLVTDSSS